MTPRQMVEAMKSQGVYSEKWRSKLDLMSDKQIVAIYFRLKRKGVVK